MNICIKVLHFQVNQMFILHGFVYNKLVPKAKRLNKLHSLFLAKYKKSITRPLNHNLCQLSCWLPQVKKDKASLNGSQNFIIGNCRTDFIEFHLCLPSNAIKTDDQIRF